MLSSGDDNSNSKMVYLKNSDYKLQSFQNIYKELFESQQFSDLNIISSDAGQKNIIKAHSIILLNLIPAQLMEKGTMYLMAASTSTIRALMELAYLGFTSAESQKVVDELMSLASLMNFEKKISFGDKKFEVDKQEECDDMNTEKFKLMKQEPSQNEYEESKNITEDLLNPSIQRSRTTSVENDEFRENSPVFDSIQMGEDSNCSDELITSQVEKILDNSQDSIKSENGSNYSDEEEFDINIAIKNPISGNSKNKKERKPKGRYKNEGFKCPICSKMYSKHSLYNTHLVKAHKVNPEEYKITNKPFKCQFCDRAYVLKSSRKDHELLHTKSEADISCTDKDCAAMFKNKEQLRNHVKSKHNKNLSGATRKQYKCNFCDKQFLGKSYRDDHELLHTKNEADLHCKVSGCKSVFKSEEQVRTHKKSHLRHEEGMKLHWRQKRKLNIEGYNCPKCEFICSCLEVLKKHVSKFHLDTKFESLSIDQRPFKCHFCEKTYPGGPARDKHELSHKEIRDLKCPIEGCPSLFYDHENRKEHIKKSHPEKWNPMEYKKKYCPRFECPLCGLRRSNFMKLHLHITDSHSDYAMSDIEAKIDKLPYKCVECLEHNQNKLMRHKEFDAYWKLRKHQSVFHTIAYLKFVCKAEYCIESFNRQEQADKHYEDCHVNYPPEGVVDDLANDKDLSEITRPNKNNKNNDKPRKKRKLSKAFEPLFNEDQTCKECGKFVPKQKLLHYQRFHWKLRPYQCQHCGDKFSTTTILQTHVKFKHSNVRIACPDCNMNFVQDTIYRKHMLEQHGKKVLWKCEACEAVGKPSIMYVHRNSCKTEPVEIIIDEE